MSGTIKPLTADDLESVIAIDSAITGILRRGFFEKRLACALKEPRDYLYVALHEDGKLVGYALAKLDIGEFGQTGARASFDAIGVDRHYRGQGAGKQLVTSVENILAHKGVDNLTSQVEWSDPDLLGFFSKLGFSLSSRIILSRDTSAIALDDEQNYNDPPDTPEIDHSAPQGDQPQALANERMLVRSMEDKDLNSIVKIDRKITATDRTAYYRRKQHEALHQSGVRVSLIAEMEGFVVGFIMVRVDFGEYGHTNPQAVMDALGVDPDYQGHGVGSELMAKMMANLSILQVDTVRTEIEWNDTALVGYLGITGFSPAQTLVLNRNLAL